LVIQWAGIKQPTGGKAMRVNVNVEKLSKFHFPKNENLEEHLEKFSERELDLIGLELEEIYGDELSGELIFNLFRYEPETAAELIGIASDDFEARY